MKTYAYESRLAPYIVGLIQQKRSDGYRYEFEAYILHHFDQFCLDQGDDPGGLTRDVVMAWVEQRPTESKNYRNQRMSFVRQLALYMISLNCEAYIPPTFAPNAIAVPHILSPDELHEFYQAVDRFQPLSTAPSQIPAFCRIVQRVVPAILLLWSAAVRRLLSEEGCCESSPWPVVHLSIQRAERPYGLSLGGRATPVSTL